MSLETQTTYRNFELIYGNEDGAFPHVLQATVTTKLAERKALKDWLDCEEDGHGPLHHKLRQEHTERWFEHLAQVERLFALTGGPFHARVEYFSVPRGEGWVPGTPYYDEGQLQWALDWTRAADPEPARDEGWTPPHKAKPEGRL